MKAPVENRLGPYVILETIGRGASGKVFRARSPQGAEVAVKLLVATLSPGSQARFARERDLLAQLGEEAGFVALLDAGSSPHGPYVVMQLMRGGSLRERFVKRGPLSLVDAGVLARELAAALAACHLQGVVHRDLKPSNILYTSSGQLRVADLGLAKFFEGDSADVLSQTGSMRGTVGYMPLEQMNDAKHAGPPADVFAWGAILYEALAGLPPFGDEAPMEVVYNMQRGISTPLRQARPEVPAPLATLIHACLASEPGERCRDGGALLAALEDALSEPLPPTRSSGLMLGVALTALGLIGAGVAFGLYLGTPPTPSPPSTLASPPPATSPSAKPSPATPTPTLGSPTPAPSPTPRHSRARGPAARPFPAHLKSVAAGHKLQLQGLFGDYRGQHTSLVTDVAWDSTSEVLVSVGLGGWVRIWDPLTGDLKRRYRTSQQLHAVDLSPAGDWAILGGIEGAVLMRISGSTGLKVLPKRGKCVSALYLPEGKQVVVTEGQALVLYEAPSGREIWRRPTAHLDEATFVNGLCFIPARDEIVSGQKTLKFWSRAGKLLRTIPLPAGQVVEDLAISAEGDRVYVSTQSQDLLSFRREGPDEPALLRTNQGGYTRAIEALPSGALLTGHDTGAILFRLGSKKRTVGRQTGWIHCLRLSPNGRLLASGGNDTRIRVWRLGGDRPDPLWIPTGHSGPTTGLTSRGTTAFSQSRDGIRVWDQVSGRQLATLPPEAALLGRVRHSIVASPNARRIVRSGAGIVVDDLTTGRILSWRPDRPKDAPLHVSFLDEDTLAFLTVEGQEIRIDLSARRLDPRPGATLSGLRSVPDLGLIRVHADRVELTTPKGLVKASPLPGRPQWASIDEHGATLCFYPGLLHIVLFKRDLEVRVVKVPLEFNLNCTPALSPDHRWLAIADDSSKLGLIRVDQQPLIFADELDFAPLADSPAALSWCVNGELLVATNHGPILRYKVR
ncbi:MAG: protein kinase [Planctomycetes bacterium]|nr:protein kinase [Planctomycetota bacterium]